MPLKESLSPEEPRAIPPQWIPTLFSGEVERKDAKPVARLHGRQRLEAPSSDASWATLFLADLVGYCAIKLLALYCTVLAFCAARSLLENHVR